MDQQNKERKNAERVYRFSDEDVIAILTKDCVIVDLEQLPAIGSRRLRYDKDDTPHLNEEYFEELKRTIQLDIWKYLEDHYVKLDKQFKKNEF